MNNHQGIKYHRLIFVILVEDMGYSSKGMTPSVAALSAPVGFLANDYLSRVSRQSRLSNEKGDNEMTPGVVCRSYGIYLKD